MSFSLGFKNSLCIDLVLYCDSSHPVDEATAQALCFWVVRPSVYMYVLHACGRRQYLSLLLTSSFLLFHAAACSRYLTIFCLYGFIYRGRYHHWTDNTLQMRVAVVVVNRREVASVACGVAVRRPSTCGSSCWRCCRAATTVRATSSGPTASEASSSCSTPRPCRDCGASRRTSRAWTMRRWDERSGTTPHWLAHTHPFNGPFPGLPG